SLPPVIKLVELEPIADNVFTQKGLPSQRLQTAQVQVKQWQNWIRLHRDGFVSELKKRLRNAALESQTPEKPFLFASHLDQRGVRQAQ
ncbi:MAG: hypothetical protein J2P37_34800, partial [Ktedonobacteraceae bacterium]|nr:hypothetical protein [Ktedonobacteraceae bacterium]